MKKSIRTIPILAVVLVAAACIKLAAGGAIVSTIAVFAGAVGTISGIGISSIVAFGIPAVKAFAIGALAFNFNAFVVAPLMGVIMNGIKIGTPKDPTPYPGEGPIHPAY